MGFHLRNLAACLLTYLSSASSSQSPTIVHVIADDLGYDNLG